jgi:flagellar secretion chaperone FliS
VGSRELHANDKELQENKMFQSSYDAYLESRVLSATPLELVHLLYRGAIGAVQDARHHLADGKIAERSRAISKACAILIELSATLDHNAGGELPGRLSALYDYMQRRLLEANLQQSDPPLGEVLSLLVTLAEGWAEISKAAPPTAAQENPWNQPVPSEPACAYGAGSWSL